MAPVPQEVSHDLPTVCRTGGGLDVSFLLFIGLTALFVAVKLRRAYVRNRARITGATSTDRVRSFLEALGREAQERKTRRRR